jgi:putative nucleotidyltransferase with HDIG domain
MPRAAWFYVMGVLAAGCALATATFVARPPEPASWALFVSLSAITGLMRIYVIVAPRHRAYEGSTIGFVAGALLLPPWLFAVQVIVAHALEWAWVRLRHPDSDHLRLWYIQPFNMAKCLLGGMGAIVAVQLVQFNLLQASFWSPLLNVALFVGVYVLINQLILGLVLRLARRMSFRASGILRDGVLIEAPLAGTGYVAAILFQFNPLLAALVLAPIVLIYQALAVPKLQEEAMQALERVNLDLTVANGSIRELNDELFLILAKIFDARDPFVGGHAAQVAAYAVAVAAELGWAAERIETLRQAAYLHDIGKIAIPESILHKPSRLTAPETAIIQRHVDIGANLIATSHGLRHLAAFIRHHHERWDGHGYPDGLREEAIPLEARILNLSDSVEAMASDRPYHRALSTDEIVAEIKGCTGGQFDPAVAAAFLEIARRRPTGFVVNSARTVAQHLVAESTPGAELTMAQFREMYGIAAQEAEARASQP